MTAAAIEGKVYAKNGAAVAVAGRPASMIVQLQDNSGSPIALDGASFIQRVLDDDGGVVLQAASTPIDDFSAHLVLDGDDLAALIPGAAAGVDLRHTVVVVRTDGEQDLFTRSFSVRQARGGVPAALFTVAPDDLVVVRYEGSPGVRGKSAYEVAVDEGFGGTEQQWLEHIATLRRDFVYSNQGGSHPSERIFIGMATVPLAVEPARCRFKARAGIVAANDLSYSILDKTGVVVGTASAVAGANEGEVDLDFSALAVDDELHLQAPDVPDATWADFIIIIACTSGN